MKRHLSILKSLFKISLMADLEFRLNIFVKVVTDIFWYIAQASVFEVVLRQAPLIGGWDLPMMRTFTAVLFLTDSFWMIFFQESISHISTKVRSGDLDLLLLKPVDSQFFISFQRMNATYLINMLIASSYLIWTLQSFPELRWSHLIPFLFIGIPVGLAIVYSFQLMFATLSVILAKAESIAYIWHQIFRLGMKPDNIYPRAVRFVILSVLPVAFVVSVPTRALFSGEFWIPYFMGPLVALLFLVISRRCWIFALSKYTSASS